MGSASVAPANLAKVKKKKEEICWKLWLKWIHSLYPQYNPKGLESIDHYTVRDQVEKKKT